MKNKEPGYKLNKTYASPFCRKYKTELKDINEELSKWVP